MTNKYGWTETDIWASSPEFIAELQARDEAERALRAEQQAQAKAEQQQASFTAWARAKNQANIRRLMS